MITRCRTRSLAAIISIVLAGLIMSSSLAIVFEEFQSNGGGDADSGWQLAQTAHQVIHITSDEDFAIQGWPGNGTKDSPYLIQGLRIQAGDWCISISNTRDYFRITNCEFIANQFMPRTGVGVLLQNVSNGAVESCQMISLGLGIYDMNGSDNVHTQNTIDQCWDAIIIDSGFNVTVTNNTQTQILSNSGITLYNSKECSVINNEFETVQIMASTRCIIIGNHLNGKGFGFYCTKTSDWEHQIENNWINDKQFGYFREKRSLDIDGGMYSQMVLVSCNDVVVSAGTFRNVANGLQVINSRGIILQSLIVEDNSKRGVIIQGSSDCSIVNSVFHNNQFGGILIRQSEGISVENNQVNYSTTGIELKDSSYCEIRRNIVHEQWDGIFVTDSLDCLVVSNNVYNNYRGIRLDNANQCDIVENTLSHNGIGVIINQGSDNSVYWNSFFSNGENARDNGQSNIWDDSQVRGNAWDDYSGVGVYDIPGVANSTDRFPYRSVYIIPTWSLFVVPLLIIAIIAVWKYKPKGHVVVN